MSAMNDANRRRILALAVGVLAAAGIGIAAWRMRPRFGPYPLVDSLLDQTALATTRELEPRGLTPPNPLHLGAGLGSTFERRTLTSEEVTRWLGIQPNG